MQPVHDWGIRVILWLQQASPALDIPFKGLTLMGNEAFFLVFFPLIYWCIDRRVGARLIILFLISACINAMVKELAAQPRPFQYDPIVQQLWPAGGRGFPSGHTQSAVVMWGYLAVVFRKTWLRVAAGLLIVLIPLSRVYLGVHFPTDLLGGYLLGGILLVLYLRLEPATEAWLAARGMGIQLAAALALPPLILLLAPRLEGYQITTVATLMGMGAGFVLERRWVGFDTGGSRRSRALRFLVGMLIMLAFRQGLGLFAPGIFVSSGLAEKSAPSSDT